MIEETVIAIMAANTRFFILLSINLIPSSSSYEFMPSLTALTVKRNGIKTNIAFVISFIYLTVFIKSPMQLLLLPLSVQPFLSRRMLPYSPLFDIGIFQ